MKTLLYTLLVGIWCFPVSAGEIPQVNIPLPMRQANWSTEGSCGWATTVTALNHCDAHEMGQYIRRHFSGAMSLDSFSVVMERLNIPYAKTSTADVTFLEWAVDTRRGCGVMLFKAHNGKLYGHSLFLVHFDQQRVGLLDNNDVENIVWLKRETFLEHWTASGGFAFAIVSSPLPPVVE